MANNPYVNKVEYGDQTVMDISDTTAEESDVASGKTFYKASGERSTGSAVIQTQTKTAPAIPNGISFANGATITPDSGKYLTQVTIPKPFGGSTSILKSKACTIETRRLKYQFPSSGYYLIVTPASSSAMFTSGDAQVVQSARPSYVNNGTTTYGTYVLIVKVLSANGFIVLNTPSGTTITSGTFYYVKLAEL